MTLKYIRVHNTHYTCIDMYTTNSEIYCVRVAKKENLIFRGKFPHTKKKHINVAISSVGAFVLQLFALGKKSISRKRWEER